MGGPWQDAKFLIQLPSLLGSVEKIMGPDLSSLLSRQFSQALPNSAFLELHLYTPVSGPWGWVEASLTLHSFIASAVCSPVPESLIRFKVPADWLSRIHTRAWKL